MAILGAVEARAAPSVRGCGDHLKRLGLARPDIVFLGCETLRERNPPLERATYRVAGKDVARVDAWLVRTFRSRPLRFVCCGWEAMPAWFKTRDGAYYEITFGGETVFNRRKDWPKVPYLTLSVTRDVEER